MNFCSESAFYHPDSNWTFMKPGAWFPSTDYAQTFRTSVGAKIFVTIQYLHSYEQKSIPDQLRWWDFCFLACVFLRSAQHVRRPTESLHNIMSKKEQWRSENILVFTVLLYFRHKLDTKHWYITLQKQGRERKSPGKRKHKSIRKGDMTYVRREHQ